jgi:hypothetical protein
MRGIKLLDFFNVVGQGSATRSLTMFRLCFWLLILFFSWSLRLSVASVCAFAFSGLENSPRELLSLIYAKELAQAVLVKSATTTKSKAPDQLLDTKENSEVPETQPTIGVAGGPYVGAAQGKVGGKKLKLSIALGPRHNLKKTPPYQGRV